MISNRVMDRLTTGIKRFQPILTSAKSRDINEAGTSLIIADMLSEVFGYDKFLEITSEFNIRGAYCDLAIKIDNEVRALIEVKAIDAELKESHTRQAVNYAANQGVDWVVLTNGMVWHIYKVTFSKPVTQELVAEIDITQLNLKDEQCIEQLYLLSKEAWQKSALGNFRAQKQALNRFSIGALLLSDPIVTLIRRELKRISPDVQIDKEQIKTVIANEVIKREVLEGDKAEDARKRISRSINRKIRERNKQEHETNVVNFNEHPSQMSFK